MKVIQYRKTPQGSVVTGAQEIDPNQRPTTMIDRFDAFFKGVPLWRGQEWKTLEVSEIVSIFRQAAVEVVAECKKYHDEAVKKHSSRSPLARRWKEFWGWKAPAVPSKDEIIRDMARKCQNLVTWMNMERTRPFYSDSNMSHFIDKPAAVAAQLLGE